MAEDIDRLCRDAGVTFATLARAAGIPHSFLDRIRAGKAAPSIETYAKLAIPLGADLSTRLYANTGPTIRDRHQARILEALLPIAAPIWRPYTEVTIWRPSHGSIDLVLHRQNARVWIAVEIESELRRLEQTVRWSREKAESLPSSSIWSDADAGSAGAPKISRLLIVRRTRATQTVAREFSRQLAVAYPAHPEDALAALRGTAPWPGAALIWADIKPDGVRFLSTR